MSAEIVNLRRARKQRARSEKREAASASAARHGASRPQKNRAEFEAARLAHTLDGARRDAPDEP